MVYAFHASRLAVRRGLHRHRRLQPAGRRSSGRGDRLGEPVARARVEGVPAGSVQRRAGGDHPAASQSGTRDRHEQGERQQRVAAADEQIPATVERWPSGSCASSSCRPRPGSSTRSRSRRRRTSRSSTARPFADFVNQNGVADHLRHSRGALQHTSPRSFEGQNFLAGSVFNDLIEWNAPGIKNPDARFHASLNTCNGCHGPETNTTFLMIGPRSPGQGGAAFAVPDGDDGVRPVHWSAAAAG